ncbi:MAG: NfeD family protein [Planctomycetota bacterium]
MRWALLLVLLFAPLTRAQSDMGPFKKIAVIVLKDDSDQSIDTSVKTSVLRRIQEARDWGADCVVFDIESYGGMVSASMETGQEMLDLGNDVHTIAYVHRKAISGAAMLAMACREIVMSENASIGDSQAIFMTAEGVKVAPEKFQTPVAAEFRKYAARNGYPIALAESMVRQEIEVWRYTKLTEDGAEQFAYFRGDDLPDRATQELEGLTDPKIVVRAGEIATFNAQEAVEFDVASRMRRTLDEVLDEVKVEDAEVIRLEWNEAEELSRWLISIRPLIFLLAIVAAYIAFKTPGTGVPEVLAIVLFGAYFGAAAIAGAAEIWEILLFFAGVGLILVEVFVLPGFGIAGFAGLFLILVSLTLVTIPSGGGIDDYSLGRWDAITDVLLDFVYAAFGATLIAFVIARFLPKVPLFSHLSLAAPGAGSAMSAVNPTETTSPLVGKRGTAVSMLRPAGRALIDGEELDVVSEGGYVDPDRPVEVVSVRGNHVTVRPLQDITA